MKRILFCLMALVALASPVRAYYLFEISGPVEGVCYGSTYTLNGVSYKIYACCDVIPMYAWHDIIQPLKFVAFITSLDDVTTEECVIPASFEHTGISFATGPIVINGVLDYRYIWATSPRDPGTGGVPANVLPSTVEVWGFSSYFNSSTYGNCSNSEIKSLRFEGELRTKEETVMVYDNAATVEFFNAYPSSSGEYLYKRSGVAEGKFNFTEYGKLSLSNMETLAFNTLSGTGVYNLSYYPKLTDVYFTSTEPYDTSMPRFEYVSDKTAHLTNEAYAAYRPDDTSDYFANFKQVLPESVDVVLSVEDGAYVQLGEQLYAEGEYAVTVATPEPLSFFMCDGFPSRAWVNGRDVSADLTYVDFLINDFETYEYAIPAAQLRPTMYVRCRANDELIHFEDAAVEALCVASWDTNGDGRLSKLEACNVSSLGETFKGNTDIQTFPELQLFTSLRTIDANAFNGCTSLESIVLPKSVTKIDAAAFFTCTALTDIVMPSALETIGNRAFASCSSLEHIDIPSKVKSFGTSAFAGCRSLKSFTFPASVKNGGMAMFDGCDALAAIIVDEDNTIINSRGGCNAVMYGTSLMAGCKNTRIPEGTTDIGRQAFSGIKTLTSIDIPASVTSISPGAFYGCSGLTTVISHVVEPFTIGGIAFSGVAPDCRLIVPYGTRQKYIDAGWTQAMFPGGIVEMDTSFDINGDGRVTIADVTTLVNQLLNGN